MAARGWRRARRKRANFPQRRAGSVCCILLTRLKYQIQSELQLSRKVFLCSTLMAVVGQWAYDPIGASAGILSSQANDPSLDCYCKSAVFTTDTNGPQRERRSLGNTTP